MAGEIRHSKRLMEERLIELIPYGQGREVQEPRKYVARLRQPVGSGCGLSQCSPVLRYAMYRCEGRRRSLGSPPAKRLPVPYTPPKNISPSHSPKRRPQLQYHNQYYQAKLNEGNGTLRKFKQKGVDGLAGWAVMAHQYRYI